MFKRILLLLVITLSLSALFVISFYAYALHKKEGAFIVKEKADISSSWFKKVKERTEVAMHYAAANGYNTKTCFLIDMSLSSGKDRFFVVDMGKDSLLLKGLVTHGNCNKSWLNGREYGNTVGCGCTSLGKYRIGKKYFGKFGLAFKLYGLDSTNDNAYKRYVVLHSHGCVPSVEVDPAPICQSNGCPTVSPQFLQKLKPIIESSTKPVLLYIYE